MSIVSSFDQSPPASESSGATVQWVDDHLPYIIQTPAAPWARVLLAHGAGAGMEHPVMAQIAQAWWRTGVEVIRFEFPYMVRRRNEGVKAPPGPISTIVDAWERAVDQWIGGSLPTVVAGKSMGGRAASMMLAQCSHEVAGCLCFGYPFHPPRKPSVLRVDHLPQVQVPTLIVQGTRDAFGKPAEVAEYSLGDKVSVQWLDHCDHDLNPTKRSGLTQAQAVEQAVTYGAEFLQLHLCAPNATQRS